MLSSYCLSTLHHLRDDTYETDLLDCPEEELNEEDEFEETEISPPPSPAISSSDYCPFNNINNDIAFEILKQLDFCDHRNLALTCRKWHEMTSSAPDSSKPIVVTKQLKFQSDLIPSSDYCTNKNRLFFNKWYSTYLTIDKHSNAGYLQFLYNNKSRFIVGCLHIELPILCPQVNQAMELLMENTKEIVIRCSQSYYDGLYEKCLFDGTKFLTNHKNYAYIADWRPSFMDSAKLVLEQWVRGERPNTEIFVARQVGDSRFLHTFNLLDYITSGIREFVRNRVAEYRTTETYGRLEIIVPGLPDLIVHHRMGGLVLGPVASMRAFSQSFFNATWF